MLLNCPNCKTTYDVRDDLVPSKGKKLRCARCSTIWTAYPVDAVEKKTPEEEIKVLPEETLVAVEQPQEKIKNAPDMDVPEPQPVIRQEPVFEKPKPQPLPEETVKKEETTGEAEKKEEDVKEIFARLASKNEEVFKQEQKQTGVEKAKSAVSRFFGLARSQNRTILFVLSAAIFVLLMFYARFGITRIMPFMSHVYAAFNIKSVIPGYGLEFENVTRREYEEDYVAKIEIKGFISNKTSSSINIPILEINMLDKDTNILQVLNENLRIKQLFPEERRAFSVIITKPAPMTKYILLTFAE